MIHYLSIVVVIAGVALAKLKRIRALNLLSNKYVKSLNLD